MKVRTSCNRDCPDACGIIATVEEGKIVKLAGDPDHPVTRGFLCYRTNRFLERQYDPERLTSPMLRDGSRHRPIGWDEALDRIATTMLKIRDEDGGAAILQYKSGGSLGLAKHITEAFFERFGPVTVKSGDICSGAGDAAQETDFGEVDSHDLFDLENSRAIVLWGKNPYASNVHLLPLLKEARERGVRIAQIDPVQHRGSELGELYVQPRPGGDAALILGLIRRVFETERVDPGVESYCDNVDGLRQLAFSKSIEEWAAIADVSVGSIEALLDLYSTKPATILVGWGLGRRRVGSASVRLLDALAAITGNIGVPGGGCSFNYKRRGAFDLSFFRGVDAAPRAIPEPLLGQGILEAKDPAIRMVFVHLGNPVAMLPDSATVARALQSRELTVVVDAFMTDTASCADIVLPTTTMLEDSDLVGSYGNHYLGNVQPVVPPPDGVLTDFEIMQRLAERVGLADEFSGSIEDWKRRMLRRVADHGVSLEALEQGTLRNPLAPVVQFAERKFPTATGKINLIHAIDVDPPRTDAERPLLLTAISTAKSQGSQWPSRLQQGPARVTIHPDAANGFAEGDVITVESAIGAIPGKLRFDATQRRDVALMDKGGWFRRDRSANALIPAQCTDAGGGAVYYDTPVRLIARQDAG